jgi:hypothetical protein
MKFTLPIYLEGDIIDRTDVQLSEQDIQGLLDAMCASFDNKERGVLRKKALELCIIDPPVDKS